MHFWAYRCDFFKLADTARSQHQKPLYRYKFSINHRCTDLYLHRETAYIPAELHHFDSLYNIHVLLILCAQHRVVHGSIFITNDPTQPTDIQTQPDPTQPTARWTYGPMTQPNPLKTKLFDPFPTQPNPRVNRTHGQLWHSVDLSEFVV